MPTALLKEEELRKAMNKLVQKHFPTSSDNNSHSDNNRTNTPQDGTERAAIPPIAAPIEDTNSQQYVNDGSTDSSRRPSLSLPPLNHARIIPVVNAGEPAQRPVVPTVVMEPQGRMGRLLQCCAKRPLKKEMGKTEINRNLAFIMEGPALVHLLGDPTLERMLFEVMQHCVAVIACRVSPKQKAQLVRLVKQCVSPEPVTLAIGDGANDVGMIQEAHVGVGISGNEGQQAVNASDFAVAQFRFLKRLLLVHGRWNYRRMSKVVLYSFYKNLVLVMTLFFFLFYSGFSGTSLYEDNIMAGYNFFLGLPILILGLFDKDVTSTYVMNHPGMYLSGRKNMDLNVTQTVKWIVKSLYDSFLIYFLCRSMSHPGGAADTISFYTYGLAVYSVLILTMDLKVGMTHHLHV